MRSRVGLTIAVIAVLAGLAVAIVGIISARRPAAVVGPAEVQIPETGQPSAEQALSELPDLTIEGAEVTRRVQGKVVWHLSTAGKFDYDRNTQALRAQDIRWELTRQGQENLIVQAPAFLASYPERTITFSQGVTAYTADKSQFFEMPELVYQTDTQKLIGQGRVRFRYGQYQAIANRLIIDNRAKEVRMSGGVRFARLPTG